MLKVDHRMHMCNCIGPQNGAPRCPCAMRGVIQRDGRWVVPEQDLGPVSSHSQALTTLMGKASGILNG
jgi:hypothetical protein